MPFFVAPTMIKRPVTQSCKPTDKAELEINAIYLLHHEKNFIFTKMCFRISFLKILFSKKMDFVDRKEEQASL